MRRYASMVTVTILLLVGATRGDAQRWTIGGNMGLSTLGGSAGFHLTPVAEMLFRQTMAVGSEFSLNTQYGSPWILHPYFKYYFAIRNSDMRPYADAGPILALNVADTPSFGILVGGGLNIPLANRLSLAPDLQFGSIFGVGGGSRNLFLYGNYYGTGVYGASSYKISGATAFLLYLRCGIRYEL